jgi:hypothetical protein
MSLWLKTCAAAALIGTLSASAAQAQSVSYVPHHPIHHRRVVAATPLVRRGDIVVHAGRSYLDPGPPAWYESQGRGDRYVADTTPGNVLNDRDLGPTFGVTGFEVLPSRFNPPGQSSPLFTFSGP